VLALLAPGVCPSSRLVHIFIYIYIHIERERERERERFRVKDIRKYTYV